MSRRDFMKALGVSAAGISTATALAPAFSDLDEMVAKEGLYGKRPWWIKEREHLDTTTEIDWTEMKRYSENDTMRGTHAAEYRLSLFDQTEWDRRSALKKEEEKKWLLEEKPGYSLKDVAYSSNVGSNQSVSQSFLGAQKASTPEARGVAKWEGSPEEAASMLRTFLRSVGAMSVGIVELEEGKTKKLIYDFESGGKIRNVWEDTDTAIVRDLGGGNKEHVLPNKFKYAIEIINQESMNLFKVNPTLLMSQIRYGRNANTQAATMEFIRGLGYQAVGQFSINAIGIAPALATISGRGEMGRMNRLITPEHGPIVGAFTMLTNLPLAPDKPIDAGYMRFCKDCMKCAETCAEGAISFERDPYWETIGAWNNAGHRAWFEDSRKCAAYRALPSACTSGKCLAVCTFSKDHTAGIHTVVQATLSATPMFNGFFKEMDDIFYHEGLHNPEKFWDIELPTYAIDSTINGRDTHS
jgi:reductive dehalogenase